MKVVGYSVGSIPTHVDASHLDHPGIEYMPSLGPEPPLGGFLQIATEVPEVSRLLLRV